MAAAPGLVRFAARYTGSLPDAEDAYQRAMEIALTKAPVTEPRPFLSWLHTVLKHEAIAVARARRREGPGVEDDVAAAFAELAEDGIGPEAVVEWRDRYRAMQDALAGLTEAQRVCLMLQSAGASYARIGELTGYTARKIERSVLEGRRNLHQWEVGLASGEVCASLLPAIDRVAAGEGEPGEARTVRRHLRHCHPCRAVMRSRRESREWLAALVPVALVGAEAMRGGPPDPTPALAYWERLAGGMTVRMGQLVQVAMELPGAALAKVGAGTAAVAIAGVAGAPVVVDAIRPAEPKPAAVEVAQVAESTPRVAPTTSVTASRPTPAGARRAGARLRTVRATFAADPPAPAPTVPSPPATSSVPAPPATSSPPPSAAAIALEFGP
jgi:RNA polymerase sigma factor (sigma-70 family)